MSRLLRSFAIIALILVVLAVCYSLYARFLVDYSLESLEFALMSSDKKTEGDGKMGRNIYQALLNDLAVEEATKEDANLKDLALLEVASRSFEEAVDRAGDKRAKLYLTESVQSKRMVRHQMLKSLDQGYRFFRNFYFQMVQLIRYFQKQFSGQSKEPFEVSSMLLLTQAEDKEKKWQLDEAADLYRRFLKFYPDHPDYIFVALSLGEVLMKQKKYNEAERMLRGLTLNVNGVEEYQMVTRLLTKVQVYKKSQSDIARLKDFLAFHPGAPEEEKTKLRLALLYLNTYAFKDAEALLRGLSSAKDGTIRTKSKFYLAWVYKLQAQYDQGADVFLDLMQEKNLSNDVALGLKAQLADIYYRQDDKDRALEYYKTLTRDLAGPRGQSQVAQEAWSALADSESAAIYFFDMKNAAEGQKHLDRLQAMLPNYGEFSDLKEAFEQTYDVDLRDLAFVHLQNGNVYEASDLFKKKIEIDPNDAWTYGGLATISVLLSDLPEAGQYAEKALTLKSDEYTRSVAAYVAGYQKDIQRAIGLYQQVLNDPGMASYIPARYNLACLYLEDEKYQEAFVLFQDLESEFSKVTNRMRSKILNNLGCALFYLGKQEQALTRFSEALSVTPGFYEAQKNLDGLGRGEVPQPVNFSA